MKNKRSLFFHSVRMLSRNLKSYAMLSVTIVMSFSVLLGYMAFTDSTQFNKYKEIFAAPREVVMGYTYALDEEVQIQSLISSVQRADPEVKFYRYYDFLVRFPQYRIADYALSCRLTVLPAPGLPVFTMENLPLGNSATQVFPTEGRTDFDLKQGEVIVNRNFYQFIGGTGEFPLELQIPMEWKDGTKEILTVQIVGLIEDHTLSSVDIAVSEDGRSGTGVGNIVMTQDTFHGRSVQDMNFARQIFWFYSDTPEAVSAPLRKITTGNEALGMPLHCVHEVQDKAQEEIRLQAGTKAVICAFMFLLLGINLYSSFTNALADRKFEIGVKRALGASAWSIVRQFLTEGMLVMLGNTLLSVLVVVDILCLYKLYCWFSAAEVWTIYISGYSAAMFGVCSMTLTVVFSALFGYKSTQVEIIQYLKAE